MSVSRQTYRAGSAWSLLDGTTGKVVASATADNKGFATVASIPPGFWREKIVYTESDGRVITQLSSHLIDFETSQAAKGALATSPDGSVWQLQVSNAGALSAVKLA